MAIPKRDSIKGQQIKIRFMLPCSVQCTTCGQFIYAGKKFNARKEEAVGFAYLGIRVWRFYIHCDSCSCEVVLRTDPKNSDYVVENGANRNFEPWKQDKAVMDLMEVSKAEEERENAIQALENRAKVSKHEMDTQDALEEIRELNKKKDSLDTEDLIEEYAVKRRKLDGTEDAEEQARLEEEQQAAQAFAKAEEEFVKLVTESDSGSEAPHRIKRSLFSTASLLAAELPDTEADSSIAVIGGAVFIKPKAKKAKKDKKDKKEKKDKKQKEGSNELVAATAVVPVADSEEDSEDGDAE
jgi:hypothetical protein